MKIVTLCGPCAEMYGHSYRVETLKVRPTTTKAKKCEQCGSTFRDLLQYKIDKKKP